MKRTFDFGKINKWEDKSMITNKPLFVFMDESGRKESDHYFVCGFLEVLDNQNFSSYFQRVVAQIKNLSIRNRSVRAKTLKENGNIEELYNLARTFNEFGVRPIDDAEPFISISSC